MITLEQLLQAAKGQQHTVTTAFATQDLATLNYKLSPESWSMLECLEHLNRYSRYYLPALAKAIASTTNDNHAHTISYSWLGKKSLDMVRPQNMKKHKTVKHMNPNNSQLTRAVVDEFLNHQKEVLALLSSAKTTDIHKKAIPVEFFKLLKLRIGETFEFVITHQDRHIQQAMRVKQEQARQVAA